MLSEDVIVSSRSLQKCGSSTLIRPVKFKVIQEVRESVVCMLPLCSDRVQGVIIASMPLPKGYIQAKRVALMMNAPAGLNSQHVPMRSA